MASRLGLQAALSIFAFNKNTAVLHAGAAVSAPRVEQVKTRSLRWYCTTIKDTLPASNWKSPTPAHVQDAILPLIDCARMEQPYRPPLLVPVESRRITSCMHDQGSWYEKEPFTSIM
jgi:hypothetical protein